MKLVVGHLEFATKAAAKQHFSGILKYMNQLDSAGCVYLMKLDKRVRGKDVKP